MRFTCQPPRALLVTPEVPDEHNAMMVGRCCGTISFAHDTRVTVIGQQTKGFMSTRVFVLEMIVMLADRSREIKEINNSVIVSLF